MNQRFHYTVAQKIHILNSAEENKDEENSHPITSGQLRAWTENQEKFRNLSPSKQRSTYIVHPGPKIKYADLYTFLYSELKERRHEMLAVNHDVLIGLAMEADPRIRTLSQNGKRSMIDRFMKLFDLSLRTINSTRTSEEQIPIQEEEVLIESFKADFLQTIENYGVRRQDIYNMDQSGLNYEVVPRRTIELRGTQRVNVAVNGGEKKRATIFSLINAAGEKFKQYVIIKGVYRARIHDSIQEHNDEFNQFSAQKNAWTDYDQLNNWLVSVWYPIAQSNNRPKILLLDSYPLHLDLKSEFEKFNTIVKFVPKGLTWTLQPLDSLYHQRYKALAKSYFLMNQKRQARTEEEWRLFLIQCVKEVYGQITTDVAKGSWRSAGLEFQPQFWNSLDESMLIENEGMIVEEDDINLFA